MDQCRSVGLPSTTRRIRFLADGTMIECGIDYSAGKLAEPQVPPTKPYTKSEAIMALRRLRRELKLSIEAKRTGFVYHVRPRYDPDQLSIMTTEQLVQMAREKGLV